MGKYSMTKSRSKRSSSFKSPLDDGSINQLKYLFGDVGAFGIYPVKLYDSWNYMNDYLDNRGLSWEDMKYPSLAPKSANNGSGLWKASEKAIKRLYE